MGQLIRQFLLTRVKYSKSKISNSYENFVYSFGFLATQMFARRKQPSARASLNRFEREELRKKRLEKETNAS